MPFVKSEIVIKGEKQKIFDVIQDMASYPKFMKNLVSVEVLEKGENYDISHWVSNVDGRKIVWTERDDFYPETFRITYKQTAGDLKKMEGAWELVDTEDGVNVSLAGGGFRVWYSHDRRAVKPHPDPQGAGEQ